MSQDGEDPPLTVLPESAGDIDIRELELEDLPRVFALGERLFRPDLWPSLYRTWDEYELTEFFLSDGETCRVAEWEGRVVGFVLGTIIEKRHSSWIYGYLVWLGVDPRLGRMGLGARLVRHFTELCIEQGARMMLVDTAEENEDAIAFFHRMGFGNEEAHIYLSKNLTHEPRYVRHRRQMGRLDRKGPNPRPRSNGNGGGGGPRKKSGKT
jgi:ribosomal protein S18 acetylase RimI-like enzyme